MTEDTQETKPDQPLASPEQKRRPAEKWGRLGRADLELLAWLVAGFVLGIVLKVTTVSAYIIAALVLVAVIRLYYEGDRKPERNPRPAIGMVPSMLLGWGLGLFIRALIS